MTDEQALKLLRFAAVCQIRAGNRNALNFKTLRGDLEFAGLAESPEQWIADEIGRILEDQKEAPG